GETGVKMSMAGAARIGQDTGLAEVRRGAEADLPPAATPGSVSSLDIVEDFAGHVLSFIKAGDVRPLTVVVDAANGMAGKMVPPLFARLPIRLVPLYFELDGSFPNHPADPLQIENLADLRAAVIEQRADLGLAFDGDADRVFLVDEKAEPVSGSLTTALVAARVLAPYPRYWDSGERNTEVTDPTAKLKELAEAHADGRIDWLDGLTVDYPDWWFNARPSNTEPLLRLNVEATTAELGESKTSELLALVASR